MELRISPEKEAQLRELASRTGKSTGQILEEAVDRLLNYEASFAQEVEKGLAQAERGEFVEHEEAIRRIEKKLQRQSRS